LDFFGGWTVQKRSPGRRWWYWPDEDATFGVLDSQTPNVYPTEKKALRRIALLKKRQQPRPTEEP
jgi:hypothetical protein